SAAAADELLWQKLKAEPNLVVLMRHTQPAPGNNPLLWDETGDCKGESMLTPEGIAHAKRIGEAFRVRGIKLAVLSSPMCRCRDTARLAFGDPVRTDPQLREISSADSARARLFETTAQSLISRHRGQNPVVLVTHRPNIDLLTMELIAEGELLVGRANDRGEVEVLGRMSIP
ncbi:MAG TPA: phosphoglycerate mutase family protein, partial [Usitatibacter sp.]|nr:phosphoglycerate mutase family protein [Usitatibacter sp.]